MNKKATTTKLSIINTDAVINMDDIVSIFTSKYEERLYNAKDRLTAEIREGRKVFEELVEEAKKSVDSTKFMIPHPLIKVNEHSREYSDGTVTIAFYANDDNGRTFNLPSKQLKITKARHNKIKSTKAKLNTFSEELNATMVNIRDIGRKERQVRARIIEQKLEETGLEYLLNDKDMQKLIELK